MPFLSGGLAVQVGWLGLRVGGHLGAESAFIRWSGWTLAMALPWWQYHNYYLGYYYYYYENVIPGSSFVAVDCCRTLTCRLQFMLFVAIWCWFILILLLLPFTF